MSPLYDLSPQVDYVPMVLPMPFTLGDRGGPSSFGAMFSQPTADTNPYLFHYDLSTTTYTDETTDARSAGASDVTIPDPFDTGDIVYFGSATKFSILRLTIATAGSGDDVANETVWEYYNGSTWATLSTNVIDSLTKLTAAAGDKYLTFTIPTDWAAVAVNTQSAYWIRLRSTADDVYNTTNPVLTRAFTYNIGSWEGPSAPATGTITSALLTANTISGSGTDTVIQIINSTQSTSTTMTWTAADVADVVTGLDLDVTAGDKLGFHVVQEQGSTEFADGSITLYITA